MRTIITAPPSDALKIIQLSDTHLFSDDESELFGVKSNKKMIEVMDRMMAEEGKDTDLIFLTGDLSADETPGSYEKVAEHLKKWNAPVYWIPGNHDHLIHMEQAFNKTQNFFRSRRLATRNWDFIFLDTKEEGAIDGFLSDDELSALKKEIASTFDKKKLAIVMHHHPAEVNTPLIDQYILRNRKAFWDIVAGSRVDLIMCGHVHGDYRFEHENVRIETSPATCLQWEKGTTELKQDKRVGYKIFSFSDVDYKAQAKLW